MFSPCIEEIRNYIILEERKNRTLKRQWSPIDFQFIWSGDQVIQNAVDLKAVAVAYL